MSLVLIVNAGVIGGMWLRHGQLADAQGPGAMATALGQLSALYGTYAVLIVILLMSRLSWLERYAGLDRLSGWHRWSGFAATSLLLAHVALTTIGYAQSAHVSIWAQTVDFVSHYPDVLMAFVATGLILAVAASSARAARRRLQRETWYGIHLYAYLAVALAFAHQLAVGSDFTDDPVARLWWIALYAAVFGSIFMWRIALPAAFNVRHRLRVHSVQREGPGVVSIWVTGRDLASIRVRPGQFFMWRTLTRDGWWRPIPLSLSAPPHPEGMRLTVKALGDSSARLQRIAPGTRVIAEGPYGAFTPDRRSGDRTLLIAGGIGVTPLRAMLDELVAGGDDIIFLYRVESKRGAALAGEVEAIAKAYPNVRSHVLVGRDIGDDRTDQLGLPALRTMVPDAHERDVFICGPKPMMHAVMRRLRSLGVPRTRIHHEQFEY